MEVWKPAQWKTAKIHWNEHTLDVSKMEIEINLNNLDCNSVNKSR